MSHSSFRNGARPVAPSAVGVAPDVNGVPACGVQVRWRDSEPSTSPLHLDGVCTWQGADGKWHEHEIPDEMSTDEIAEVVAAFGRAAALAKSAGFDGIEVHAGSGYLLDTFLQTCSNVRTDAYGGSPDRRFAILAEVSAAASPDSTLSSPSNLFHT